MVAAGAESYLKREKERATGAAQETFLRLEDLYTKKHWNQLTGELKKCLRDPSFTKGRDLVEFYEKFVSELELRLNILSLVEILVRVAQSVEPKRGVELIESLKGRLLNKEKGGGTARTETEKEALVLANSTIICLRLAMKDGKGKVEKVEEVRELVECTEKEVDALRGVSFVNGEFHKAQAAFLCEVADHAGYYREALRYLGCVDLTALSDQEKQLTAQRLCVSALLGKDVYNFGELLAHPILNVLTASKATEIVLEDTVWLVHLVRAFNAGNIGEFRKLEPLWSSSIDLKRHEEDLVGKLRLLSVMERVFETAVSREARSRQVPFTDLAAAAAVPLEEVELLVMKALSRGLVKGSIDQVDQSVNFTWIQPRVLDKTQVADMGKRVKDWSEVVAETSRFIDENAKELVR